MSDRERWRLGGGGRSGDVSAGHVGEWGSTPLCRRGVGVLGLASVKCFEGGGWGTEVCGTVWTEMHVDVDGDGLMDGILNYIII